MGRDRCRWSLRAGDGRDQCPVILNGQRSLSIILTQAGGAAGIGPKHLEGAEMTSASRQEDGSDGGAFSSIGQRFRERRRVGRGDQVPHLDSAEIAAGRGGGGGAADQCSIISKGQRSLPVPDPARQGGWRGSVPNQLESAEIASAAAGGGAVIRGGSSSRLGRDSQIRLGAGRRRPGGGARGWAGAGGLKSGQVRPGGRPPAGATARSAWRGAGRRCAGRFSALLVQEVAHEAGQRLPVAAGDGAEVGGRQHLLEGGDGIGGL